MRVYNFAAGPATLPLEVLEQVRDELTDWRGCGMSVMEISHRSKAFVAVAREAEGTLRELLGIPREYKVLFLQGGATAQFAAIPLNLAGPDASVDYLNTGIWSKKAIAEAERLARVHIAADEAHSNYTTVPAPHARVSTAPATKAMELLLPIDVAVRIRTVIKRSSSPCIDVKRFSNSAGELRRV